MPVVIKERVIRGWLSFVGVLLLSVCAVAQTGSIRGVAEDPTGAVLVGATVTVHNPATGEKHTTASGNGGNFTVSTLAPGTYEVTAQSAGFNEVKYTNLVLSVDQVLSLTVKFTTVGSTGQIVEVRGDVLPQVDTETSQVSNLVDAKTLNELPLILRDPYSLILLSPGTVQSNSGLGGFSVNGSRERNNNFLLDGVDNNDTSVPGIPSGLLAANPDSTDEFRVITNNFSPEFGRNTGAIINVVTKSGTNTFHGGGYWFGRYNYFGARDYFNTPTTGKKNPYVRNILGGSLGGPIYKNKTFFFFNGDFQRFRTTQQSSTNVPSAAFKSGLFNVQDDAGNSYPVDLTSPNSPNNLFGLSLDPTVAAIFAKYPTGQGGVVDPLRNLLFFPSSSRFNQDAYTLKLDHNLTDREKLSFRGGYDLSSDPNPFFDDFLPGIGAVGLKANVIGLTASLTSTLSNTIVNDFRAGFNRTNFPFFCGNLSTINSVGPTDSFGRGRDYGFDGIASWGCGGLGDSNGQSRRTGTYSLTDGLALARGNHTMKVGGEYRFVFENGFDSFSSRESLGFNPVTDFGINIVDPAPGVTCDPLTGVGCFNNNIDNQVLQDLSGALLGLVTSQSQSQFFNKAGTRTPDDQRAFRQKEFGIYFQDSWKVRQNLTLNLGIRYQLNGIPYERDGNLSTLIADPSGLAPFTFQLAGHDLYKQDYKNIEPRVGFAWDPYKNGKTSFRGGYGIFHDRIFGNLFGNARGNPPFQRDLSNFPGAPLSTVPLLPTATPTATIQNIDPLTQFAWLASPVLFDRNLRIPYSQNWNVGFQREIAPNLSLELNYVGSHGTRELRVVDGNPPQPALVAQLLALGIAPSTLTFNTLRFGALIGALPFNAVNNTAFGSVALNRSIGNSTYHSLQMNLQKRLSHGLDVGAAYTWSHAIDDSNDPLVAAGSGGRSFPRNSFNLREERGNSGFDIRHRAVVHYTYELPVGRGKQWLANGFAGRALEHWMFSGITSVQTGFPIDFFGNRDTEHTGFSSRLDYLGGTPIVDTSAGLPATGPSRNQFARAQYGFAGNSGRNQFYGPGFVSSDLVLSKKTAITERLALILRAEGYNIFNHPNFGSPSNTYQSGAALFGHSTNEVGRADGTTGSRQMQFSLKLEF